MRFVIQAIKAVYGQDWQGTVVFDNEGDISRIVPTDGSEMPSLELVSEEHNKIEPRLNILAELVTLDGVITREREDLMSLREVAPTTGPLAEAIATKVNLRQQLASLNP